MRSDCPTSASVAFPAVRSCEFGGDPRLQAVRLEVAPIGVGGRGEARRDVNALAAEHLHHLAERRILAADPATSPRPISSNQRVSEDWVVIVLLRGWGRAFWACAGPDVFDADQNSGHQLTGAGAGSRRGSVSVLPGNALNGGRSVAADCHAALLSAQPPAGTKMPRPGWRGVDLVLGHGFHP